MDRVEAICKEALKGGSPTDPSLFDRITDEIAAAGLLINRDATANVRKESPNIVAVYSESQSPDSLVFLEIFGEDVGTYDYYDGVYAVLIPASKISWYYEDPELTTVDLAELRFIERDGERWYDTADLDTIATRKKAEAKARREAMRNLTMVLPDEFLQICQEVDATPAAILEGFIADLCHLEEAPYFTNGSDERLFAEQYFERCGYRFMAELVKRQRGVMAKQTEGTHSRRGEPPFG